MPSRWSPRALSASARRRSRYARSASSKRAAWCSWRADRRLTGGVMLLETHSGRPLRRRAHCHVLATSHMGEGAKLPEGLQLLVVGLARGVEDEVALAVVAHVGVEPPLGHQLHVAAQVSAPQQVDDRPVFPQ